MRIRIVLQYMCAKIGHFIEIKRKLSATIYRRPTVGVPVGTWLIETQLEKITNERSKAVQSSLNAVPRTPFSSFVISPCYGGFGVSKTGMNLYRQKYEAKFRKPFTQNDYAISHQDPLLVEVVQELGQLASTECSHLVILYVSNKYADFLRIREYDGCESVHVDVGQYKLATAKLIVKDVSITAEEKIQRIDAILHDDCVDSRVFEDLPEGGYVV